MLERFAFIYLVVVIPVAAVAMLSAAVLLNSIAALILTMPVLLVLVAAGLIVNDIAEHLQRRARA